MVCSRELDRGRFSVEIDLANFYDVALVERGVMPPEKIRKVTIRGVVDSGSASLVIPESVAKLLEVPLNGHASVRYADGRAATRNIVGGVQLSWGGRKSVFDAIIEPGRDSALIGAIVLEALDLVVDCRNQKLSPRDPHQIISEIE